ncbi:Tn3 family transposase [Streptomyces sp. NPDC056549]|uniref:Tn3 family transposase n=1 Tax=Streptomyces sp. NPDC056549 TaxID=3345864 RepID=UPI0036BFCCD0
MKSVPVFALAHLLGFDLMPRIRTWKGVTFYRPSSRPSTSTSTPCSPRRATTSSNGT